MSSLSANVVPSDDGDRKMKRGNNGRDDQKASKKMRPAILSASKSASKTTANTTEEQLVEDKHSTNVPVKKRKRPSPFRIKVGCVVALRHKPGTGNHVAMLIQPSSQQQLPKPTDDSSQQQSVTVKPEKKVLHSLAGNHAHVEVWTDPVPGRDEGLALIGRRVRCVLVRKLKAKVLNDQQQQQLQEPAITAKKYIVEGEIVAILEYGSPQWQSQRLGERQKRCSRGNRGIAVEMLVDQELLASAPFLERTDEAVDVTQLKKESAKRAYKNEEKIRGKNKAIVKVFLEDPSGITPHRDDNSNKNKNNGGLTTKSPKAPLVAKWAVRKRVPAKPGQPIYPPDTTQGSSEKKRTGKSPGQASSSTGGSADGEGASLAMEGSNGTKLSKLGVEGNGVRTSTTAGSTTAPDCVEKNGATKQNATDNTNDPNKKRRKEYGTGKNVPAAANTKFLGDGNDDPAQQQQNWRWLAMRYHDLYASTFTSSLAIENPLLYDKGFFYTEDTFDPYEYYSELLSSSGGVLVGEVLEVTPSKSPASSTLAMVTIRRLILPEHTSSGRLPLKSMAGGTLAIFDDFDSSFPVGKNPTELNSPIAKENGRTNLFERSSWGNVLFHIPIEELVIVSRKLTREYSLKQQFAYGEGSGADGAAGVEELHIPASYSLRRNVYVPLNFLANDTPDTKRGKPGVSALTPLGYCHRCRNVLLLSNLTKCECPDSCILRCTGLGPGRDLNVSTVWWCTVCLKALGSASTLNPTKNKNLPCCRGECDCRECLTSHDMKRHYSSLEASLQCQDENQSNDALSEDESTDLGTLLDGTGGLISPFSDAVGLAKSMPRIVDFDLTPGFMDLNVLPMSSGKQITSVLSKAVASIKKRGKKRTGLAVTSPGEKKKKSDSTNRSKSPKKSKANDGRTSRSQSPVPKGNANPIRPARKMSEDYSVFKPTCSRLMDHDTMKVSVARRAKEEDPRFSFENFGRGDMPRNLREIMANKSTVDPGEKEDNKLSRRALRANQRRFMKDVTTLGASSLALDTLAGREQQLRFDRSGIHAWGVYTDVEISAEEMIVEYRGVLIGNAMAEKMQEQYERENIGSDYMFTIDDFLVCDATKEGNVARFINASCDPNCYTKIITSDGRQRIVIYAKRDIHIGEELSYDYKFALENNPARRIPCHCGASECRGYLNWDKKFKEVATDETKDAEPSGRERTRKHATKGLSDDDPPAGWP